MKNQTAAKAWAMEALDVLAISIPLLRGSLACTELLLRVKFVAHIRPPHKFKPEATHAMQALSTPMRQNATPAPCMIDGSWELRDQRAHAGSKYIHVYVSTPFTARPQQRCSESGSCLPGRRG